MTMRLSDEIKKDLLDRGLAISAVEELIKERCKRTLRNRLLQVVNDAHQAKELGFTQPAEELNFDVPGNLFPCPGDNLIRSVYVASFNEKKHLFTEFAKWISCDHTFKAAVNIGFERKEDGAWITQYTPLFCIINEKGQVIR